jgi:quercetin dioxygenase-like cupin family protein
MTLAVLLAGCSSSMMGGHGAGMDAGKHVVMTPGDMKWGDAPAGLPPGAKAVVLDGDPSKHQQFTIRVMAPAGYKVPAHTHPQAEHVTVLSGNLYVGDGPVLDETKATKLPPGGFVVMPVGHQHYAFSKEETVIQVHGVGPWGITYVNPDDDPRKTK